MITQKNYFAKAKEIGIENLPDTFKKSHELVTKVTQGGGNWSTYNSNETIKRMIDLYFDKLSQYKKPSVPAAPQSPPPQRPSKKREIKKVKAPEIKVIEEKYAPKTTKPKNEAKKSNSAFPVERLDDEITLIKRYINFHDKQKTRDQLYSLLKSIQKAILERRVNKNSVYGKEVMQIQDSLLGALKHDVKIFDVKIKKLQLERYTNIATGIVPMSSIQLIKRYVGLQNKTGILDKVERLYVAIQNWTENNSNTDKYWRYMIIAKNNLKDYKKDKHNKNASLKPFSDAELNGLGFLPTIIAATAGACVQAITHHHLNKKKNNLSGTEPEVMSVSDAKNETFKEIGLTGDYLQLIGRACAPTSIFIYGNGGSGKSGLALKLADKLHQLNHSVLYAAGEQYGTPTFTELLKKVNIAGGANFKIVKSLNTLPIANFDVIVIDSKEAANINKSSDFKQLRDAYPDKIWIITSQGLKSGEYKGDGQWLNEVEAFIYCEGGKASTIGEKNRWGGKAEIKLF